jgi:hypothetical protein
MTLVGGLGAASAAVISSSVTTGPSFINVGSVPSTLSLLKFDTTLGTLNSATLTVSMDTIGTATAANFSGVNRTLNTLSSATEVTLELDTPALVLSALATVAVTSGLPLLIANGDSVPFTGLVGTTSNSLSLNAGQLLAFSGVGVQNIDLDVTAASSATGSSTGVGGNSNLFFYSGDADVVINLSIEYDYTPPPSDVPEPATLLILGASLLGIGIARHRRRS